MNAISESSGDLKARKEDNVCFLRIVLCQLLIVNCPLSIFNFQSPTPFSCIRSRLLPLLLLKNRQTAFIGFH